jgi:hypothetical protein
MRSNFQLKWIAALVAGLTYLSANRGDAQEASPTSPWITPVPWSAPTGNAQPMVRPAPSAAGLSQMTPAHGATYSQALPTAGVPLTGVQSQDAVYLDGLTPMAPAVIEPAGLAETIIAPANQITADPLPPGARDGVFQKLYFTGTWLPALSEEPDALGFGDLETGVVLGFPFMRRDTPLLVTPQFGAHLLDNEDALDVPSELYDAAVEFRHMRKFGGGPWAMDAAVTVGYYSDFEQGDDEAVRVSGRALGVYEPSPTTKWLFGAAYLNRAGASVLPVAGVIYEPRPDMRWELIFPKPRFAWQLRHSQPGDERWAYVAGEFGGGIWSITRPSTGQLDLLSYSDWRLLVGFERKVTHGLTRRFEFGYVFNRELEYDSGTPEVALDDTLFVRAGLTY